MWTFVLAHADSQTRCKPVHGKLLDERIENGIAVAKMIGRITGDYTYTLGTMTPAAAGYPNLIYVTGTSEVETKNGTLSFVETSTQDTAELGDLNGTVLMTITGGTGQWQGASGHIVLVGFFHQDTLTGEWKYQGEVCTPK
jgi:hypothetical protein